MGTGYLKTEDMRLFTHLIPHCQKKSKQKSFVVAYLHFSFTFFTTATGKHNSIESYTSVMMLQVNIIVFLFKMSLKCQLL